MNKIKERYDYLDLLKTLAMLMVVSLHTGLWHTNYIETKSIGCLIQYCIRLICEGVPIFVLINGFLIINKDLDLKKHLKKIFKIIFLIVLWSAISFLIINLVTKYDVITFKGVINNTLTVDINNYYNGPLWFLQNLLMLYFIYPVINYVFKNNKKLFYYLFYVVTFFTFINGFISSINFLLNNKYISNTIIFINNINPIKNGVFIFYFMLGGAIYDKKNLIDIKRNKLIIIFTGIIAYIISILFTLYIFKYKNVPFSSNYIYGRIPLAFIILGLFCLIYSYKNKNKIYNKIIEHIGSNTLGIFLMHVPLKRILFYYNILKFTNLFNRIISFFIVFICSYVLTILIKRIPYVNKIISI